MAMFSAVILAGGSASRMNGINKQLALLDGIPVVIRSALAFENSAQAGEMVQQLLVLAALILVNAFFAACAASTA